MTTKKTMLGKEEWCAFKSLGIPAIKARVDTGAKTSSLHAFNMTTYQSQGKTFVSFDIHPLQNNRGLIRHCEAEVFDMRIVKSSTGEREKRIVILAPLTLGEETWTVELTLTNRDSMGYRMLLGREAMKKRFYVDPEVSFCQGEIPAEQMALHYPEKRVPRDGYNILLLASNPDLYSNRRIMDAASSRGHNIRFVNIKNCYINICSDNPKILYQGNESLSDIDAVIPRIRPSITYYGCAVLRQLQSMGAFCLNDSAAITGSRDKLQALQILAKNNIATPTTGFAHRPQDTESIISMVGGSPLIVKLLEGTQGKGVVLAETKKAAESVIQAFKSIRANILVQEFIKEAQGKDLRCLVVGGRVIGAIQREAAEGEFRANLHLGGQAAKIKLTAEEKETAIKSAKAMGLYVAGVDLIRSKTGPKVLEVNSSPGLEGIEGILNKDIAYEIILCLEKKMEKIKSQKRL